jgi:hypothetical protein
MAINIDITAVLSSADVTLAMSPNIAEPTPVPNPAEIRYTISKML